MIIKKSSAVISLILFVLFFVFACNNKQNVFNEVKEMKKFNGIWQLVFFQNKDTVVTNLEILPFVKIEENKFVVSLSNSVLYKGYQKIVFEDKKKDGLDLNIVYGSKKGNKYKAIYYFDKTKELLSVCFITANKERPKSFKVSENKDYVLIRMEKVK
ncbi:MAG: hypothetical protein V1773_12580 [bacterium]